jgi:hypothetical protein
MSPNTYIPGQGMSETVYNLFLYFESDVCSEVGWTAHEWDGGDDDGIEMLKARIGDDVRKAVSVRLKCRFTREQYNAWCRIGRGHELYDEVFDSVGASASPLFLATPVVDGKPKFNFSGRHTDGISMEEVDEALGRHGKMPDWLFRYATPEGIDLPGLIHDDYFVAIKLLFNSGLFVSATKLLLSSIDSVAYIEYGDGGSRNVFVEWLSSYSDLSEIGVSAEELWELRNGLLHMTNLQSRRVASNKVRRISIRVGPHDMQPVGEVDGIVYLDFSLLIRVFSAALSRWLKTYNEDQAKFPGFVQRYDETVSDVRLAISPI